MLIKEKNIFILFWFLILISINSYSTDFIFSHNFNFRVNIQNIYFVIELIRFTIPFFIFIYLFSIFVLNKKKKDNFFIIFFIYSVWQLIVGNFLNTEGIKLNDYQITISFLCVLLLFYMSYLKNYNNLLIKFFYIFVFYITLIGIYFTVNLYRELINNPETYYFYLTKTLGIEQRSFGQVNPRITGLGRILLIIFYALFYFTILKKHKILSRISYISILFFLVMTIYASQTRLNLVGIFILLIIYIFLIKENLLKKFLLIFLIFIIPIISFELILLKKKTIYENMLNEKKVPYKVEKNNDKNIKIYKEGIEGYRLSNTEIGSSGRTVIWKNLLNIIDEKKLFFGKGPQADRILLSELYKKKSTQHGYQNDLLFGTNSSNALIYSFLCGGFISLVLLIKIYYLILKKLYNFYRSKNIKTLDYFFFTALCFLIFRSIFENSFALFGIDFCLLCLSFYLINQKKNQI